LGLISNFSLISAYKKELDENSKLQISTVDLGSQQPLIPLAGPFLGPGVMYGKLT
jgi:hypothetical protein